MVEIEQQALIVGNYQSELYLVLIFLQQLQVVYIIMGSPYECDVSLKFL